MEQLQTCLTTRNLQGDLIKAAKSASLAKCALNKLRLHGWTPRRTSLLTAQNIKTQLEYVRRNLDNTECWETVLWTDETKGKLFRHMDQHYIWCVKGLAYNHIMPTVKHGGGSSLMMWSFFSAAGPRNFKVKSTFVIKII